MTMHHDWQATGQSDDQGFPIFKPVARITPEAASWAAYFRQCRADYIRQYRAGLDRCHARRRTLHVSRLARMLEKPQ